jgi:mRNA-degrading endonuclease RelE of RelBE toxin-antitoxin system
LEKGLEPQFLYKRYCAMQAVWTRSAWKELQALPKTRQSLILEAVAQFAADPFGQHPNARPLVGEKNAVRLRIGDYRAILHRGSDTIVVRAVAHRREICR